MGPSRNADSCAGGGGLTPGGWRHTKKRGCQPIRPKPPMQPSRRPKPRKSRLARPTPSPPHHHETADQIAASTPCTDASGAAPNRGERRAQPLAFERSNRSRPSWTGVPLIVDSLESQQCYGEA
eukprot:360329-Chlamydomonas_euryale.AAC.14